MRRRPAHSGTCTQSPISRSHPRQIALVRRREMDLRESPKCAAGAFDMRLRNTRVRPKAAPLLAGQARCRRYEGAHTAVEWHSVQNRYGVGTRHAHGYPRGTAKTHPPAGERGVARLLRQVETTGHRDYAQVPGIRFVLSPEQLSIRNVEASLTW